MEKLDDGKRPQRAGIVTGLHRFEKRDYARRLRHEMTPSESLLWEKLRAGRLNGLRFRRQQIIDGFIVDFFCYSAGLIIEVDGEIHAMQTDEDEAREDALQKRHLQILRFTNEQVTFRMPLVLEQIRRAIDRPK